MQSDSGLYCWTCQISCHDQQEWNAHIASPQHAQVLQQSNQMAYQQYYGNQQHFVPTVPVPVPQPFVNVYSTHHVPHVGFAPVPYGHNYPSNVHQPHQTNFHKHTHKRDADLSQPKQKKFKKGPQSTQEKDLKTYAPILPNTPPNKQSPNTSPQHKSNHVQNRAAAGKKFYCQLCDCYTTDESALIAHYNGKKHAARVQATTEQSKPSSEKLISIPSSSEPVPSSNQSIPNSSPSAQPNISPIQSPQVASTPSSHSQTSSNHNHKPMKPFHSHNRQQYRPSSRRENSQPKKIEGNLIGSFFYGVQIPISRLHDHMYDNYLATVQSEITPSSTDTLAMENLLKLVLESLLPGDLIQEAKIVGSYAKGTIIDQSPNPLLADVVVLMKEIPFAEHTSKISEMISSHVIDVKMRVEKSVIYLDGQGVTIRVLLTWLDIWKHDSSKESQNDRYSEIDFPLAEIGMMALSHLHWFITNIAPNPILKATIQLLKYYQSTHDVWKPLHPWAVDVLVFRSAMLTGFKGGLAYTLRAVFQYVAGGVFLDGAPGLLDPLSSPLDPSLSSNQLEAELYRRDIAASLTVEQRHALTRNAQETLIEISLHRWAHVLCKAE